MVPDVYLICSSTLFLRMGLSLSPELTDLVRYWLASKPEGASCLFSALGLQVCATPGGFIWVLGNQTHALIFHKQFTD